MRKILWLAGLVSLFPIVTHAETAPEPKALVQRFYDTYLTGKPNPSDNITRVRPYVSRQFGLLLDSEETCRKASHETCAIESDIILNAQDWDDKLKPARVRQIREDKDTLLIEAEFDVLGRHQRALYRFVKEKDGWKLDDIDHLEKAEHFSLKKLLVKQALEMATGPAEAFERYCIQTALDPKAMEKRLLADAADALPNDHSGAQALPAGNENYPVKKTQAWRLTRRAVTMDVVSRSVQGEPSGKRNGMLHECSIVQHQTPLTPLRADLERLYPLELSGESAKEDAAPFISYNAVFPVIGMRPVTLSQGPAPEKTITLSTVADQKP